MAMNRRKFLAGVAGAAGAVAAGSIAGLHPPKLFGRQALDPFTQLVAPNQSGIEHIVLVTMENRSLDHFLGWLPGANGKQAGLKDKDPGGVGDKPYRVRPDSAACPLPHPHPS